jgi:hypothetical protein
MPSPNYYCYPGNSISKTAANAKLPIYTMKWSYESPPGEEEKCGDEITLG